MFISEKCFNKHNHKIKPRGRIQNTIFSHVNNLFTCGKSVFWLLPVGFLLSRALFLVFTCSLRVCHMYCSAYLPSKESCGFGCTFIKDPRGFADVCMFANVKRFFLVVSSHFYWLYHSLKHTHTQKERKRRELVVSSLIKSAVCNFTCNFFWKKKKRGGGYFLLNLCFVVLKSLILFSARNSPPLHPFCALIREFS